MLGGSYKMSITKNKTVVIVFAIFIIIVLITGGIISMQFFNKKKENSEIINLYITENDYENNIQKKEILFDWKQGTYYAKIIFKDEPQNYYEMYVAPYSDDVYVIAFDKDNVEITDNSEAKYIDN